MATYPKHYRWISSRFGKAIKAHQRLGTELLAAGPLKKKQAHLVQLAAGAKPDEIYHALVLLVSTIGFPAVSAALSWAREIIENKS